MTSYSTLIEMMRLSCTVFELLLLRLCISRRTLWRYTNVVLLLLLLLLLLLSLISKNLKTATEYQGYRIMCQNVKSNLNFVVPSARYMPPK